MLLFVLFSFCFFKWKLSLCWPVGVQSFISTYMSSSITDCLSTEDWYTALSHRSIVTLHIYSCGCMSSALWKDSQNHITHMCSCVCPGRLIQKFKVLIVFRWTLPQQNIRILTFVDALHTFSMERSTKDLRTGWRWQHEARHRFSIKPNVKYGHNHSAPVRQ